MSAPAIQGDGAAMVPPAERPSPPEHASLVAALAAFQAELPAIGKGNEATVKSDKGNYKYSYADLADVSAVVLPALARHGLAWLTMPTYNADGKYVLEYELLHSSGSSKTGTYPLPAPGNAQAMGSAITYARRYVLCAVTGVAPEADDDDGQLASVRQQRSAAREATRPPADDEPGPSSEQQQGPSPRALALVAAGLVKRMVNADGDALKRMWSEVYESPAANVDVSGLLGEHRDTLGIREGEVVPLLGLRARVASYMEKHQCPVSDPTPIGAGEPAEPAAPEQPELTEPTTEQQS